MAKLIDTILQEMKQENELYGDSSESDTFEAIGEVATKQVLRNVIREGNHNQFSGQSKKTAMRIDIESIGEEKKRGCPPGYVFDRKKMDCVPKSKKDSVVKHDRGTSHDYMSNNFRVWGRTGVNGDGYAWEDDSNTSNGGGESSGGGSSDGGGGGLGECTDTPIKDIIKFCMKCKAIEKVCQCNPLERRLVDMVAMN